jgi:hypothetical protein
MLVLSKQLIEQEFSDQFDEVNIRLQQYIVTEKTTYRQDKKEGKINY